MEGTAVVEFPVLRGMYPAWQAGCSLIAKQVVDSNVKQAAVVTAAPLVEGYQMWMFCFWLRQLVPWLRR